MKRAIDELSEPHPSPANKKIKLWSASDYLVQDTLKLILSKLDPKNQRHARLVCKQWYNTINISDFNIGRLDYDELLLVIKVLGRYSKPISIRFKNLENTNPDHFLQLSQLTNLTSFRGVFMQLKNEAFLSALTGLNSLMTCHVSGGLLKVLTNLTELSCLYLTGELAEQVTRLKKLEITSQVCSVSLNNFPNLKSLVYLKRSSEEEWKITGLESLVMAEYNPKIFYPVTLTRLDIHQYFYNGMFGKEKFCSVITTLTNLKHFGIPGVLQQELVPHFPLLEKCDVGSVYRVDVWKNLAKCSHLTWLKVQFGLIPPEEYILALTKLRDLYVRGTVTVEEVDMSLFSSLVNLTRFTAMDVKIENSQNLTNLTALQHLETYDELHEPLVSTLTNLTSLRFKIEQYARAGTSKLCFTNLTNLVVLAIDCPKSVQLSNYIDDMDNMTHLTRLVILEK